MPQESNTIINEGFSAGVPMLLLVLVILFYVIYKLDVRLRARMTEQEREAFDKADDEEYDRTGGL